MGTKGVRIASVVFLALTASAVRGQTADGCPIIQVTAASAGESANPRISADGRWITFQSSSDLTGGNGDGSYEVFLLDRVSGLTEQVTSSSSFSGGPSISAAGNRIAFYSSANLTGENPDGSIEVYMYSLIAPVGLSQLTSSVGLDNDTPAISPDGAFVVYRSTADPSGTNPDHSFELFRMNIATSALVQVTVATTGASETASVSSDGSLVALYSTSDLAGENADGSAEVFLYDAGDSSTTQVTDSVGLVSSPELSADGSTIVFHHFGDLINGVPGSSRVYEYATSGGTTTQISTDTYSIFPSTTSTGNFATYLSIDDLTGQNPDNNIEIFVRRASDGHVSQVTDTTTGDNQPPILSADGRWLAFYSNADLTGGNADASFEVFLTQLCVFGDGFESGDTGEW